MTTTTIITRLVDSTTTSRRPRRHRSQDALRGQRLVRRRRTVSGLAAAAAVVLVVGIVQVALSNGERSEQPAPEPTPSQTESPSGGEEWTPERIRAEGRPGDPQGAVSSESGLTTRLYEVCDGTRCSHVGPAQDLHVAIEVAQDGRSALFDLHWHQQPWVRAFDEDSVLVQDPLVPHSQNGRGRFRLLQADGTAVELELLDPTAAVTGPDVVLIEDYNGLGLDSGRPHLIDDRAGTVRPLDVPAAVRYWGPNVGEFLWGVTDDCRVYWATDGTFEERRLDCAGDAVYTFLEEFPPGWLQPGRMAAVEETSGGSFFVHVSLNSGATWQRIPVADGETAADVLRRLV